MPVVSRRPVNPDKVTLRGRFQRPYLQAIWEVFSPQRIPGLHGIQLKAGPNAGMYSYKFYHYPIALQVVLRYTDEKRKP